MQKKERSSFLEKRSKRLLNFWVILSGGVGQSAKVFWFFFSKKNAFHAVSAVLTNRP
jgi:hypothetical protein